MIIANPLQFILCELHQNEHATQLHTFTLKRLQRTLQNLNQLLYIASYSLHLPSRRKVVILPPLKSIIKYQKSAQS